MNIEEKVKLAMDGDEKAFEYLMEISKEGLYRTAYAYVKNQEDALDILQDTVYKAYISIDKLKEPKYFKTWITRILINNAINFINKEKKIISLVDNMSNDQVYHNNKNIEDKIDMFNSIDKLEDKYRKVIVLKYFRELTVTEVAEVLNCPVGTVKTHLNKALSKLRVFMGKEIV